MDEVTAESPETPKVLSATPLKDTFKREFDELMRSFKIPAPPSSLVGPSGSTAAAQFELVESPPGLTGKEVRVSEMVDRVEKGLRLEAKLPINRLMRHCADVFEHIMSRPEMEKLKDEEEDDSGHISELSGDEEDDDGDIENTASKHDISTPLY